MADTWEDILQRVPAVERPVPLNDERTIAALAEGIRPELVDWALEIARDAAEEAYRNVSPARFEALAEVIGKAIESISINLIRYLLAGRDDPAGVRISRAQRVSTLDAVRIGIPLRRIVGGIRALDHRWRRTFIELVLETMSGRDAAALLTGLDRSLAVYFGALVDENTRIYTEERQRLVDQRVLGQRQLLERVIAGIRVDDDVVAEVLGVGPHDEHIALIVSPAPDDAPAAPLDFARYRQAISRRFAERVVNAVPVDQDTLWIVLSGAPQPPALVAQRLADIAVEIPGALVSVGLPAVGTAGLRMTHLTAAGAHELNRLSPSAGPIVSFAERGLPVLAAQAPELARRFIDGEVGPLREGGPLMAELRTTLRTLIGLGGSLARTSEALFVHRNTIAYRLKRIEDILGRDPLARPVETGAALLLAEYFDDPGEERGSDSARNRA